MAQLKGTTISGFSAADLRSPAVAWSTGLGLGFLPKAPGTWGSIGALGVWWFGLSGLSAAVQLMVMVLYFCVSLWACQRVCDQYGLGDAGEIVADECLGLWLSLWALPQVWWLALLGFALFRVFDIKKPWVIGRLDRNLKGGLGILADDMAAGAITCALLWALVLTFRALGINLA